MLQQHAESAKTYLLSKGIPNARLTALGFGHGKPITSNKTSSDKANRIGELITSY
nr:OmpA family protein [uncultured Flavobacterium sp.]